MKKLGGFVIVISMSIFFQNCDLIKKSSSLNKVSNKQLLSPLDKSVSKMSYSYSGGLVPVGFVAPKLDFKASGDSILVSMSWGNFDPVTQAGGLSQGSQVTPLPQDCERILSKTEQDQLHANLSKAYLDKNDLHASADAGEIYLEYLFTDGNKVRYQFRGSELVDANEMVLFADDLLAQFGQIISSFPCATVQ